MIGYLSKEGEIVFDPFAGSGIVPYIAKEMNRKYLGIELNEDLYNASMMQSSLLNFFKLNIFVIQQNILLKIAHFASRVTMKKCFYDRN